MAVITIEVDGVGVRPVRNDDGQFEPKPVPINVNWFFKPLQKSLRGKFDLARAQDSDTKAKAFDCPVVPGQRIILDTDAATATLIEPLRDPANASLVKRIARYLGHPSAILLQDDPLKVGPRETVHQLPDERDIPTWLYWLKRGVEAGCCRVISGTLPEKIEGKPRKRFVGAEPGADPVVEMNRQQQALSYAMLTEKQREAYDKKLAELRGA